MKKFFQCIGSAIYGIVASYLLWLFFFWITPYIMGVSWMLLFLYIVVAGGLLSVVVSFFGSVLSVPMFFLMRWNIVAKIINAVPFLFHGYSAACLPWRLPMDYGMLQYCVGIGLSINTLIIFGCLITAPFIIEDDHQ